MLNAGSVVRCKTRFFRLYVLENVQHDAIGPVPDRVYVLIMGECEPSRSMSASIRTTCHPCRHACSIPLRISSGSVVSKPEVELLSE